MGHHLGGKAASYVDGHGRKTEHGWHMVLGFYDRMRALLRSAGVDPSRVLASLGNVSHPYEAWSERVHTLDASGGRLAFAERFSRYDGLPFEDRAHLSRFMAQAFATATSGEDLTRHDDICFSTWATEHGLFAHITRYSLFRMFREAYFNFPEQISAYHVLQTLRLMNNSDRAEAFVCRGGWSDLVWGPVGRRFTALGGVIEPYTLVTDWIYDGRRITGIRTARPDPAGHADGKTSWQTPEIPIAVGTERILDDFDFVVSTIPHAVFVKMNAKDERMWSSPYFARLKNLRSAATVAMRVTTDHAVMPFAGPVFGFPAPLGIATNMKPYLDETRDRTDIGAAIHFVGQERGFERWTDEQIASFTLDRFSSASGIGDLRAAGIAELELHRNRSDFERILLCEPGVQRFRPGPLTPFSNLVLAGDWVTNEIDLICMEGAIASGHAAADIVIERVNNA
jgi:uncharacterized protein with NAD-binding domain and iron-sulfur cluster